MALIEFLRRHRIALSAGVAVLLVYLARPTPLSIVAGLPLVLAGESIRTWSSGHIRKNKQLATDGPYAYSRNPLYLGSFVLGLGFAVSGNSAWVVGIFLAAFGGMYTSVIQSEERDLARVFGAEFELYRRTVPRFLPRLRRRPYGGGEFDWALVHKHREYQAWFGIAAELALLAVKAAWAH